MFKKHAPEYQQKMQALQAQVKAGTMSKSELQKQQNNYVTERLEDPNVRKRYTDMAQAQSSDGNSVAEGMGNEPLSLLPEDKQFVVWSFIFHTASTFLIQY